MAVVAKRTIMTLYSRPHDDMYSHNVRIVLAEKGGMNVETIYIDSAQQNPELLAINPYYTTPTLVDRDLVLYEARIITEYLDERFPHPPLLPVYPVLRAQSRKMIYRIERDWYSLAEKIINGSEEEATIARRHLEESLVNLAPVFANKTFFFSDEFTLIDCCLAPLLWRLPQLGIDLPTKAKPIKDYAKQIFARDSFQSSLTEIEKELMASNA